MTETRIRIALDVMGGDHGPSHAVRAAVALTKKRPVDITLVGHEADIQRELRKFKTVSSQLNIHHAPYTVTMGTNPKDALRTMPNASIFESTRLVREGLADAVVTTGHTGGAIMGCSRDFSRLPGVRRGALAAVFPTARTRGDRGDPFALILDSGATLDATADDLVSFAHMGNAYAQCISRNPEPMIALLSNGTEPNKGRSTQVEAYRRLLKAPNLNFVGNIEGVDLPMGNVDVIVTDGYTGNIVLKLLEGVGESVAELAKYAYRDRWKWRIGLLMLHSGLKQLKLVTDWRQYGGAPVLGFNHLLIKAHGRSNERAITNAVKVATRCVKGKLIEDMQASLMQEFEVSAP